MNINLLQAIKDQIASDKRTKAVRLSEACTMGIEFSEDLEGILSDASAEQLVAICSIINDLHNRVEEILENYSFKSLSEKLRLAREELAEILSFTEEENAKLRPQELESIREVLKNTRVP